MAGWTADQSCRHETTSAVVSAPRRLGGIGFGRPVDPRQTEAAAPMLREAIQPSADVQESVDDLPAQMKVRRAKHGDLLSEVSRPIPSRCRWAA